MLGGLQLGVSTLRGSLASLLALMLRSGTAAEPRLCFHSEVYLQLGGDPTQVYVWKTFIFHY